MLTWILGYFWSLPRGVSPCLEWGHALGAFLPSCSSSVTLPFAGIKGSGAFPRGFPTRISHEAFPRGFPTGMSLVPPWCESILGLEVEAVQGKQVSLELTETSGGLWECGTTLAFLSPFLWERLLLRCDGNAGDSFPNTQAKDPSSRARGRKRGSSGYWRDSRASSRVETGMLGNFFSCSKGVKDPLEVPEVRCD